jgi:YHS domain-containing protein
MTKTVKRMACALGLVAVAAFSASTLLAGGEEAMTTRKGDAYPLDVCPVSGQKLGSMGDPIIHVTAEGREVRFCCDGCPKKFTAEPAKYLAKIDEKIIAAQTAFYPLHTCAVSGEELVKGEAVDYVYGNRLVRLCCHDCERGVKRSPDKVLAKLDEAVVARDKKIYPLKTCIISGDTLGDGAVDFVFANRLVRFCCGGCKKKFEKDPTGNLAKIDAGMKKAG